MGQFESIVKFLGKEDAYPADQIEKGLETLDENYESAADIPDEHLANVDNLLNMFGGGAPSADSDSAPDMETPGRPEFGAVEETYTPSGSESSPSETAITEADTAGVEEDVLKELENLDTPAPEISDLEKKWAERESMLQSLQNQQDGFENLLGEETPRDDFNMDFEVEEKRPMSEIPLQDETAVTEETEEFPVNEADVSAGMETESADSDMGDILRQMRDQGASDEAAGAGGGEDLESLGFQDFLKTEDFGSAEPQIDQGDEGQKALQDMFGSGGEGASMDFNNADFETPGEITMPDFSFGDEAGIGGQTAEVSNPFAGMESSSDIGMETFGGTDETASGFESREESFDGGFGRETEAMDNAGFNPGGESVELSQDRIQKIRTRINLTRDKQLRRKLRQVFIDQNLPPEVYDRLVMMLLLGESDEAVNNYLLNYSDQIRVPEEKVSEPQAAPQKGRRQVIYSDSIRKTEQSQQEVRNFLRVSAALFFSVVLLGFVTWRIIFVPLASSREYEAGLKAIQRDEYTMSEEKFLAGKKISGPDTKWYNRYALEYTKKKKFDLARKKYDEALQFKPLDRDTIFNFGDFYKLIYPRQYDRAIELYQRLAKKNANDFDALDKVGMANIEWARETADPAQQKTHLRDAYNVYANYIFKHEKHVGSYFRLLDIALFTRDEKQVDDLYARIDYLNKKAININTMTELAKFYTDLKRYDRSKAVFDKLMAIDPKYDEAFYEYARYLTIQNDFLKAMKALKYALKYNERNGKAWNLMGEIHFIDESAPDHLENAIKAFENARTFAPDYYKPYINIGHIYFYRDLNEYTGTGEEKIDSQASERNHAQAFEYYKLGKALIPKDVNDFDLSYNLSWLYAKYGQYQEAFNELAELYVQTPYNPAVIYAIANAYFHLGNMKLAKLQYDKSIEYYQAIADKVAYLNPDLERHREIFSQLARSYNNRGVVWSRWARMSPRTAAIDMDQKALLDFYQAKTMANRVGIVPYNYSEINIRTALDRNIKNRVPALDEFIPKKTTLRKFSEEFRQRVLEKL